MAEGPEPRGGVFWFLEMVAFSLVLASVDGLVARSYGTATMAGFAGIAVAAIGFNWNRIRHVLPGSAKVEVADRSDHQLMLTLMHDEHGNPIKIPLSQKSPGDGGTLVVVANKISGSGTFSVDGGDGPTPGKAGELALIAEDMSGYSGKASASGGNVTSNTHGWLALVSLTAAGLMTIVAVAHMTSGGLGYFLAPILPTPAVHTWVERRSDGDRVFIDAPAWRLAAKARSLPFSRAGSAVEPYRGKWIRVVGTVDDTLGNSVQVITGAVAADAWCAFDEAHRIDIAHLERGDPFDANCRIKGLLLTAIDLELCEWATKH